MIRAIVVFWHMIRTMPVDDSHNGWFTQIVIYYNFIIEFITDPAYICDPVLLLTFVAPAWNGVTLVQSVGLRWLACVILSLTLLSRLPTLDTHGESIAYNGRTPARAGVLTRFCNIPCSRCSVPWTPSRDEIHLERCVLYLYSVEVLCNW